MTSVESLAWWLLSLDRGFSYVKQATQLLTKEERQMNNIKNELKANFTIVPNELLLDKTISDRARLLFAVMASKPNDWNFYNNALAKELGYSVDTLQKYMRELTTKGWIVKLFQENIEGNFGANNYLVKSTIDPTKMEKTKKT